jgi:hypothetical protein
MISYWATKIYQADSRNASLETLQAIVADVRMSIPNEDRVSTVFSLQLGIVKWSDDFLKKIMASVDRILLYFTFFTIWDIFDTQNHQASRSSCRYTCLLFGMPRVQIPADVFCALPQYLQGNGGIVPQIRIRPLPVIFHSSSSSSLFLYCWFFRLAAQSAATC